MLTWAIQPIHHQHASLADIRSKAKTQQVNTGPASSTQHSVSEFTQKLAANITNPRYHDSMPSALLPLAPLSTAHATEGIFRKHEATIKRVIAAWPNILTFKVHGIQPVSFRSSFRAACRMLIHPDFPWPTDINPVDVATVFDEGLTVVLEPKDHRVKIGPHSQFNFIKEAGHEIQPTESNLDLGFSEPVLRALCLLKSRNIWLTDVCARNPPRAVVPELVHEYPELAFYFEVDGTLIIT